MTWNLGNLPSNTGGRERVSVQVGALALGSLLEINSATLSGDINFLTREVRARAVSRVGSEVIELAAEVDPDPVNAGEMLEAQISVSNPGGVVTGNLTLRLWWPGEELQSFPIVTGGGGCSGSCSIGEYMVWNLGSLGPGASKIVSFNEAAGSSTADGTLVPLEIELFEAGLPVRTISHTILVQSDSPLELAVEPLPDPVAPGAAYVYEIVYGNSGSAAATAELAFPIPAGTTFQSATGGGLLGGDKVTWNLGTLSPGGGGRERVSVVADVLPSATLLQVNAATLSADVNFQVRQTRARSVSRVAAEVLQLDADISPNPVQAGDLLAGQIHISNPAAGVTGDLLLQLRWSGEELNSFPVVTGGGGCSGSCSTGEYMVWNLGPLGPGASFDVGFSEDVRSVADGTLIPLEIELFEGGLPARTHAETVIFSPFEDHDGDGEADVLDSDDDNDGMPDLWENLHGLNPFNAADASQDPDGDGLNNLGEFLAGTDPNVPDFIFADGFESGNTSAW